ncbi:MAG: hypothetical protein A2W65_04355 [Candidatus Taylorbacteria bacterium RIFCSPLOWO2_02_50_13]|nr:MAG: hypothetical protein A2W65_04355 [Candidatus Taylorbacteria bacterium RIFCSPLOWO2_02_50_13]
MLFLIIRRRKANLALRRKMPAIMTIELLTTATFLLSTFYGASAPAKTDANFEMPPSEARQTVLADRPLTLEQYVREYFRDTPILAEIAQCESRFRHLGKGGVVLRGKMTVEDLGVMQINEFYHEDTAKTLGLDLHTLDGNLAYAKWLYTKEGLTPWLSSSKCWKKSEHLAAVKAPATAN